MSLPKLLTWLKSLFTYTPHNSPLTLLALGIKPQPINCPVLPKGKKMQTPNNSTVTRYQGVVERLLIETHCVELSQITVEHLRAWVKKHTTTPELCERAPFLLSRLLAHWTGAAQVSPELEAILREVAFPAERERISNFFGGKFDTATRDKLIEQMAWR